MLRFFKRRSGLKTFQIQLLDDDTLKLDLEARSSGEEVLSRVLQYLGVEENQYFGLSAPDGHQLKWMSLGKVARKQIVGHSPYVMYLRVHLYPRDHHSLLHHMSRHQLFLQVKQDLRDHRLRCNNAVLTQMAALAVQADIGDYSAHLCGSTYLSEIQNLPKLSSQMQEAVTQLHRLNRGKTALACEEEFLDIAQDEASYGAVTFPMLDSRRHQVTITLAPSGVKVQRGTIESGTFEWESILKASYKGKTVHLHMTGTAGAASYQTTFSCSSSHISQAITSTLSSMQQFYCSSIGDESKSRLKRFFNSRRSLRRKERPIRSTHMPHTSAGISAPKVPSKRRSTSSLGGQQADVHPDRTALVDQSQGRTNQDRDSTALPLDLAPHQHSSTPSHNHLHTSSLAQDSDLTHTHPQAVPAQDRYLFPASSHPHPSHPHSSHPHPSQPLPENPYPHLSRQNHGSAQTTTSPHHTSTYTQHNSSQHAPSREEQRHNTSNSSSVLQHPHTSSYPHTSTSSHPHASTSSPPHAYTDGYPRDNTGRHAVTPSRHQPSPPRNSHPRHASTPVAPQFLSYSASALPQRGMSRPLDWDVEEEEEKEGGLSQPQPWELDEVGRGGVAPPRHRSHRHRRRWEGGEERQHRSQHEWFDEEAEGDRQPQATSQPGSVDYLDRRREGLRSSHHRGCSNGQQQAWERDQPRQYWGMGNGVDGEKRLGKNGMRPLHDQQWRENGGRSRRHGSGSVGHSPDPYRREELPTSEMNGDAFSGGSQPPESREERIARHKAKAATFPAKPQSRRHRLSLQESNYYSSKPRQRMTSNHSRDNQLFEGSLSQDRPYRGMRSLGSIASLEIRMSLAELSQASTTGSTAHLDPHARSFVFESSQNDTATEL